MPHSRALPDSNGDTTSTSTPRMRAHVHRLDPPTRAPFFFFNDPAPPELYTLSLHDALPICRGLAAAGNQPPALHRHDSSRRHRGDRKSTRLNSSHLGISYAVFCLKKKNERGADSHTIRNHCR